MVERVFNTLEVRDLDKTTICVGSAAVAVHLAAAASSWRTPSDVDVLCSREFFVRQCLGAAELCDVSRFQIRWPYGNGDKRALSPVVDIYPAADVTLLPFSACEAMGATWFPVSYETCLARPEELVEHEGRLFLSMGRLLVWAAVAGRVKDLAMIDQVLPIARRRRLVTPEESEHIQGEYRTSLRLRLLHPARTYARVSDVDAG